MKNVVSHKRRGNQRFAKEQLTRTQGMSGHAGDPVIDHVVERMLGADKEPRQPRPVTIRKFSWQM